MQPCGRERFGRLTALLARETDGNARVFPSGFQLYRKREARHLKNLA
jgi:hypothetical protein